MNFRMVAYLTLRIVAIVAMTMIAPILVSAYYGEGLHMAFIKPMLIALLLGVLVSMRPPKDKNVYAKEGMIVTALVWILVSIIGGLPFYISGEIPSFVDCFFETASGFTTTGSSILTDVEAMSKSLLFWRSFTHWLGGMGVLVFAMAIFSEKDTQSTHMMRAEMPGPIIGKIASKWQFSVRILYVIYIGLSVVLTVLLCLGGMSMFDSLVHMFGTAGTGGFGIKAASIGAYNSAYIDYVIAVFMMLFGLNFNAYYFIFARKFSQLKQAGEVKWYLAMMLGSAVIIAFNIMPMTGGFGESFRYSFFQVSSVMTTTGYATADFVQWPMLSQMILFMLMMVGACAGSTGGGFKVIRVIVLARSAKNAIKKAVNPRSVYTIKADGKKIEADTVNGVLVYFVIYMLFYAASIIIVSFDNKDFATTLTAVTATINNIGPGLGSIGPMGSFADFSNLSKIVLSITMIAGRLELYPILLLFAPHLWRRK